MEAVDEQRALGRVHCGRQHSAPPVARLAERQRVRWALPVHGVVPADAEGAGNSARVSSFGLLYNN